MSESPSAYDDVLSAAKAYGEAVYYARAEVFEGLCHDRFQMTHVGPEGPTFWGKASYLERVRGRQSFEGVASYGIMGVDVTGDEIARVHLWVDVPPLRYEDHLGFIREGDTWKLLTKVFRTMDGSAEKE